MERKIKKAIALSVVAVIIMQIIFLNERSSKSG